MSEQAFGSRKLPTEEDGRLFVRGYLSMMVGAGLMIVIAACTHTMKDSLLGIVGLVPFFLLIHFGYASVLTSALRLSRRPVPLLFDRPLQSESLREFWSARWNIPFVEMNKKLLLGSVSRRYGRSGAVIVIFLVSGLLHELGISYPSGGGWGQPTLYFALHGILCVVEGRNIVPLARWSKWARRVWVLCCVFVPLPLLFHAEFRNVFVIPTYRALGEILWNIEPAEYLSHMMLFAGLGHFLVLIAGIQVPIQLGWSEDLSKLRPFNRKIMWNYGLFIFLLIIAFGAETLIFRDEIVSGVPSALGIAALLLGFWSLRLLVDYFYFSHEDWPPGPQFIVGHTLLNSLFLFFVLAYGSVLAWHLCFA